MGKDPECAYAFAAIGQSFLENDAGYAIGALCKLQHCEKTTVTLLGLRAKHYPGEDLVVSTIDNVMSSLFEEQGWGVWNKGSGAGFEPWGLGGTSPSSDKKENPNWVPPGRGYRPKPLTASGKAVAFILDISGSMSADCPQPGVGEGTRLRVCKRNMIMVLDKYTTGLDWVSYIEFDHDVHLKTKIQPNDAQNKAAIRQTVQAALTKRGGTNFFDAMIEGIEQLNQAPEHLPKYVICLTDGDSNTYKHSVSDLIRTLKTEQNQSITPMVIGAGPDISAEARQMIQKVVGECPVDPAVGGMFIHAGSLDDLEAAFSKVAEAMSGGDTLDEDI